MLRRTVLRRVVGRHLQANEHELLDNLRSDPLGVEGREPLWDERARLLRYREDLS